MKHPIDLLSSGVSYIGGFFLFISAMLAAINAICRYVLKTSIVFSDEVCMYVIVIAVFLIQTRLEWRGDQLAINALDPFLKKSKIGRQVQFWIRAIVIIPLWCAMVKVGMTVILRNYEMESVTTFLLAPLWTIFAAYTLGMALIVLTWIFLIHRNIRGGIR